MTTDDRLPQRLIRFALIGAGVGLSFALVAAVRIMIFLVSHDSPTIPIALLLLLYPLGGAVGGALLALAFPLTRWVGGAFLVGSLALVPFYLGAAYIIDGHVGSEQLITAVVCAGLLGGTVAAALWFKEPGRSYSLIQYWMVAVVCSGIAWFAGLHWAGQWQAALAIPLFLIPTAMALMATFASRGS